MNSANKSGATARTVSPTQQQPGRPAKQNHSTLFPASSQAIAVNTTITGCLNPQAAKLHPGEQRCLEALIAHPKGIKSYHLRELTCCSYVPNVVRRLIAKGYQITCTMEPDGFNVDGRLSKIGRYCLEVRP